MTLSILMPQLGLTMEQGTVSAWLKKPGDKVQKNEPLFSVSTDKVEMEVESLVEGMLSKILVQAGETVAVGTTLAYVEGGEEDIAAPAGSALSDATIQENSPPQAAPGGQDTDVATGKELASSERLAQRQRPVSPRAKRLAKKLGIDIKEVDGNGGRIREEDIRRTAQRSAETSQDSPGRRQLIAERLTQSIQTIPAFSVSAEANAEKLLGLYESLRGAVAEATGVKLTVTDLLLTAYALALKANSGMNAVWEKNTVRNRNVIDIGLAVATPKGVVTPLLRSVDTVDLPSLAVQRSELAEKARQSRLSLAELEGGVGTLSNLGMYRVDHFQAIINPGQSSILAAGQIRKRPWVESSLTVKRTVILNLTVDHRVADGAVAAVFLEQIVHLIENADHLLGKTPVLPEDGERGRSNG